MTFPGILFSFSLKLHFLWVNIRSNLSIIISITSHSTLLPLVLKPSPPALTSFSGCRCPFLPELQVGKGEWVYGMVFPQGQTLHMWPGWSFAFCCYCQTSFHAWDWLGQPGQQSKLTPFRKQSMCVGPDEPRSREVWLPTPKEIHC